MEANAEVVKKMPDWIKGAPENTRVAPETRGTDQQEILSIPQR